MSKIFELYGHRLDCWNEKAAENRAKAWCPFMDAECDGGGNRHLSALNLHANPQLRKFFPGKKRVQSGVCSLRLRERESPWIVCPRRLLSLRAQTQSAYQAHARHQLARYAELTSGETYRAWSEVKMKIEMTSADQKAKSFDHTKEVDTKKGVRSIPPPIAIRFPNSSDTDIAGWNGIKRVIADYLDVDEYTQEQIAKGQSRHDAMETAIRTAGQDADKIAIAFPVAD